MNPNDPCAAKHGGARGSEEAFETATLGASEHRQQILALIRAKGRLTLKEYCEVYNVTPNQVSGRFTDLRRAGLIEQTDQKKAGCYYWIIAKQKRQSLFDMSQDASAM